MKRLALLSAALIAAPALLSAQSQTVTVNATIANYVTTTLSNGTLNLGSSITQGNAASVAASGTSAAQVTANFNTSSISFSLPSTLTLTRSGGAETMSASLTCATAATTNSATTTACGAASGGAYTQSVNYNGTHQSSLGAQTLYIGGSLSAGQTANVRAGTYTGTITVTITNVTT